MVDTQRLTKRLADLVSIDSQVSKDNSKAVDLIATWFKDYEQSTQFWTKNNGIKGKNLIVKIPGEKNDNPLFFICHLDTVPTNNEWETDPFILEEQEGNLYGLGACDTKGGVAALCEAILSLTGKPYQDVYLVFDGDEEDTGAGVEKFIKKYPLENPRFIAIEPTDGDILITQRAIVKFKIITHGVPQHSSKATPEVNDRDNAIHKMAKIMVALEEDAKKMSQEKDPLLGTHTQNFGVISGGTANNVVPESCVLDFHRRLLPTRDSTKELDVVRNIVQKIDPDATVELVGIPELAFSTSKTSPFVIQTLCLAQKTIPTIGLGAFIAWSEAGVTSMKGESIILGPGSINQAHRANEYVNAKELFQFAHIFYDIVMNLTQ